MADVAQDAQNILHNLLSEIVPYPVFSRPRRLLQLDLQPTWQRQQSCIMDVYLTTTLITFFLAYFALVTAYRTVRSMLSLAWFGIKWGAIIGSLIAVWAWWTDNTDAINSTGTVPGRGGLFGQRK